MSETASQPNYARRTKLAAGCVTVFVILSVLACLGAIIFLFTACSFNKPLVAGDLPTPDRAFQTGTVAGYNVYIWDCFQNKHIVVYNATGEMYSGPYKREESACGTMTPMEEKTLPDRKRDLDPNGF